ncbi:methionyl-tRNA formyltransferase [bacterium]|nr:MAG: methionyl-tRNA formyltransferase [bacterium]
MEGSGPGPLVFFGTGEFSLPTLRLLKNFGEDITLLVTQPDRPKGRGRALSPTPAKSLALELGIPVYSPDKINTPEAVARIREISPEFLVVVDYGQILKKEILAAGRRGALNLHPSLLPRHRGPSPVAWTILCRDEFCGVTTMLMDEGMDSGPILEQWKTGLSPEVTAGALSAMLSTVGADLMADTIRQLREGTLTPVAQDESRATYSKLIDKSFQKADFSTNAAALAAKINALSPSPGCRGLLCGKVVKFLRAVAVEGSGAPGEVIKAGGLGFAVACREGAVLVSEILPEGRGAMSAGAFIRGGGVKIGDVFV